MVACVEDYIKKLTTMPRYSNLVGCTDINKACEYIRADGWATSPTYTSSLLAVVKQFNLTRYDAAIKEDKPAAPTHQEVWLDHIVLPNAAAMEFYLIAKKYGLIRRITLNLWRCDADAACILVYTCGSLGVFDLCGGGCCRTVCRGRGYQQSNHRSEKA